MIFFKLRNILHNEATEQPEDGGAPEPQISQNPRLKGRAAAMEQISAQVESLHAQDLEDVDFDAGTTTPRASATAPEPEQEPDDSVITAPAEDAEPAAEDPPKPKMVPIIVDGQTIEVDESRIIEAGKRTLQKESAADRRLQEANAMKTEATAIYRRLQLLEAQQSNTQPSPDAAPTNPQAPSPDAPNSNATANAGALLDEATFDQKLEMKLYVRDAQKAKKVFEQEFPEIANDPVLLGYAAHLENERLNHATAVGEPFGDPVDAYRKHGETVRQWLQERTGKATAPAPTAPQVDKLERKRTITAIPAVNAKAPAPQAPRVLTPSEQIAQIAAERKAYGRQLQTRSNPR